MKIVTLKEAYAASSPVPLSVFAVASGVQWIHAQRDPSKPERIPQREVALMRREEKDPDTKKSDPWLLVHAYNVLPEVVAALEEMIEAKVEGPFFHEDEHEDPGCTLQKARSALTKAKEVQIP